MDIIRTYEYIDSGSTSRVLNGKTMSLNINTYAMKLGVGVTF